MGKLTGVILLLSCLSLRESTHPPHHLYYQPAAYPLEPQPACYPQYCFEEQVDQLVERVTASATQRRALALLQRDVEDTLNTVWPGCKVKLFGSLSTGLGAAGSDVDFRVFLPHQQHGDVTTLAATAFEASQIYHNIHTRSRLPAITFHYKPLGIKCDLNFKNEGTFESELLNHLLNLDVRAFKVAYIIKYWAKLHKLIRPKYLTSYGMMMLVIFYLQQISILPSVLDLQLYCPPLIELNSTNNFNVAFCRKHFLSRNNESLYQILGGFFKFYENFDFNEWIISPFTGQPVKKILFKELKTVPKEFHQYQINVAKNISKPLNITAVCVQSLLMLNDNCAWRVDYEREFVAHFRRGAKSFRYVIWVLLSCALWCARARSPGGFPDEVARLLSSIRLSPARAALVPSVTSDVLRVLQPRFPGCNAELFGSIAAGLSISASDIDIAILLQHEDPAAIMTDAELVLETADIMLQHPQTFVVTKALPQEKIPIATITHLPSGFKVDIIFRKYDGIQNSKLVLHLMSLDQRAKDLAQILKYWARLNRLTGHTMLPSYGVVNMAIFYLQQKQILPSVASLQANVDQYIVNHWNMGFSKQTYKTENEEPLCALLGGFFKYYADFNFENYLVSPYVGYPVEIDLFRVWETVPEEFDLYRKNVGLNITDPLDLKTPIVQDMFAHNTNLARRIIEPARRQLVEGAIRYAAGMYQEGCPGYLDAILR